MAVAIPHPPRLTGSLKDDLAAFATWLQDFYKAAIIENGLVKESELAGAIADQVDPVDATAATAQATANEALLGVGLLKDGIKAGSLTISDTDSNKTVNLSPNQADTNYFLTFTRTAVSGTPAADSDEVASVTKNAGSFTVTMKAAPGAGNSVTFDWTLQRSF